MEIMVKICDENGNSKAEDMPVEVPMSPEEAVKRFRELVNGNPKGMTAMQVQEELKKVLTVITGEEPEED